VPLLGELDRVADQVQEDLANASRIADGPRRSRWIYPQHDLQSLAFSFVREQFRHVLDHRVEIERDHFQLQLVRLDLREIQDVVNQRDQELAGAAYDLGKLLLLRAQRRVHQQIGKTHHCVHGRADLMAHGRQKFALGVVGRFSRFLRCLQGVFRQLALKDPPELGADLIRNL